MQLFSDPDFHYTSRMKKLSLALTLFVASLAWSSVPKSIYEVQVKDIAGKSVPLSQYQGKVMLIVNTASQCGFTPQLKDLESLYKKYKSQGLEVMAFPSNDFKQDPKSNSEIHSYAQQNYEVSFPFFEKASVAGPDKQPLYQFLTDKKQGLIFKEVQWNFEKFLVGRNGEVLHRWSSKTSPSSDEVVKAVEQALQKK